MTTESTWWESNRQRAGRALSVFALVAMALIGLAAAGGARADEASPAHALFIGTGFAGARTVALHHPAQQDADPLRGDGAGRPARAQGRGRSVLRQPGAPRARAADAAKPPSAGAGASTSWSKGPTCAPAPATTARPSSACSSTFRRSACPSASAPGWRLARSTVGEEVPSEALCYVWDNKQPRGSVLVNAFTRRMRMIVLESGPSATRRHLDQPSAATSWPTTSAPSATRPAALLPDVVAVAVSADADNTQRARRGVLLRPGAARPRGPGSANGVGGVGGGRTRRSARQPRRRGRLRRHGRGAAGRAGAGGALPDRGRRAVGRPGSCRSRRRWWRRWPAT